MRVSDGFILLLLVMLVAAALILRAVLRARAYQMRPYLLEPRPNEIIAEIQAAPVLEQARAVKAYLGLKVRWHVILNSTDNMSFASSGNRPGATLTLLCSSPGSSFAGVICDVRRSRHPELNGITLHTPFWISGQVYNIMDDSIFLKNVVLEFGT